MPIANPPRDLEFPLLLTDRSSRQRILIEIGEALDRTQHQPLRQIELEFEAGTITLSGFVPSYYLKQLAQVAAMSVAEVERIDNRLRVANDRLPIAENESDLAHRDFSHPTYIARRLEVLAYV